MGIDIGQLTHEHFIQRCLQLAANGAGYVAPNPMVGAVLVYNNRIIGEGYHPRYGGPHAEVNCINSVSKTDKSLVSRSTLYVSLEPCAHFGKTPPCTDLIIENKIPGVIIGCRDPFKEVNGRGIEKLKAAGLDITEGILENECRQLNKRFFTFHLEHKPYIVLKWAETADGKIATNGTERLMISNEKTNRLVHKWRSEEASILVGTHTALMDDPELSNRYWKGHSPVRMVVDLDLSLPSSLKLFNREKRTIIFNSVKHEEIGECLYYQVTKDVNIVHQIVHSLYQLKIQSVLVEGGAKLLQSFIDEGLWDEIRVIRNEKLVVTNGLQAPGFECPDLTSEIKISDDSIKIYAK